MIYFYFIHIFKKFVKYITINVKQYYSKEIFNSVDKGIRAKLDDDGSFIIEKMQFENLRRINRKHLNNVLDKVNK
ncbi:hypothetical protein UT300017_07590 [Clostridium sp. CTA-17]